MYSRLLTDNMLGALKYAADNLKGSARRILMAKTVAAFGPGGQRQAGLEPRRHPQGPG